MGVSSQINYYEKKAIDQRVRYTQKQCAVLSDQIVMNGFRNYNMSSLSDEAGENVFEVEQLANNLEGRILLVDSRFKILADTYNRNCGKYLVTKETIHAMKGEEVAYRYIGKQYLQVITPIQDKNNDKSDVRGLIIAMVSLQNCNEMSEYLYDQRDNLVGIFFIITLIFSVLVALLIRNNFRRMQNELDIIAAGHQEENPNRRPKLFWVNFILFILCLVALGIFGIAPYFVFIFATVITAMLNYKDNFGEIFNKVGPMYLNILIMLLAINVYQAVFNNTGMVEALSNGLMQVCPSFLLRYLHVIMLLLCVVIIYVVPFQIFNALYPVFISIGAGFGIPAVAIIAPFVCNLSLATSSTPTNSSTYTGCALTETDVQHYCKKAVPIQTVTNAIVVLTAVLFHVLKL